MWWLAICDVMSFEIWILLSFCDIFFDIRCMAKLFQIDAHMGGIIHLLLLNRESCFNFLQVRSPWVDMHIVFALPPLKLSISNAKYFHVVRFVIHHSLSKSMETYYQVLLQSWKYFLMLHISFMLLSRTDYSRSLSCWVKALEFF